MSGGSHEYVCHDITNKAVGQMHDIELDELMEDVAELLHQVEWWCSGDSDEERYREAAEKFKEKWFGSRDRDLRTRLRKQLEGAIEEVMR